MPRTSWLSLKPRWERRPILVLERARVNDDDDRYTKDYVASIIVDKLSLIIQLYAWL
jgi:hypothetical protein